MMESLGAAIFTARDTNTLDGNKTPIRVATMNNAAKLMMINLRKRMFIPI
jgi:hypothetical protein